MTLQPADDRGESLIEILVAVLILGITATAIMGGLLTSVKLSDVHRKQATAGADVRSYAESVTRAVAAGGYQPCAVTSAYLPVTDMDPKTVDFTPASGGTAAVVGVEYWSDSGPATAWSWKPSCAVDLGLQRVTLQVRSADSRATEQTVVVVRLP